MKISKDELIKREEMNTFLNGYTSLPLKTKIPMEFIFLPNTSGRPRFAIDYLNEYLNNCLIITNDDGLFQDHCPDAIIIERNGINDANIFLTIAENNFQVVVIDEWFGDLVHKEYLIKKIKSQLEIQDQKFKIVVIAQFGALLIHKNDIKESSKIWIPKSYTHPILYDVEISSKISYYDKQDITLKSMSSLKEMYPLNSLEIIPTDTICDKVLRNESIGKYVIISFPILHSDSPPMNGRVFDFTASIGVWEKFIGRLKCLEINGILDFTQFTNRHLECMSKLDCLIISNRPIPSIDIKEYGLFS